eukprot:1400974-Prorocentrum_lima.AAC.1
MFSKASRQGQPNQAWSGRVPQPPPPPSAQQGQGCASTDPQYQGGQSPGSHTGYEGAIKPYYTTQ